MKNQGHTGTLFIQGGKYKWSYKYERCEECGTCNSKHKGRGLCTKCFDKERMKTSKKRKITKIKCSYIYHFKKRILQYLHKTERKKKISTFDNRKYRSQYYAENKIVLNLLAKAKRMRARGEPCLKIFINGKERILPFTTLSKPSTTTDINFTEWQKNMKDFELIKKHFSKKK